MNVLVAYATRHGATAGIAERIAERLRTHGLDAIARPVIADLDLPSFDAYVIGSAAYMGGWMGEATTLVRRNRALLGSRPTWLFSSGPVGPPIDAKGRNVLETSQPREFRELPELLHLRGMQVFFGAFDVNGPAVGMAERLVRHLPAVARNAMPVGDFRDWDAIDAWADGIAEALRPTQVAPPVPRAAV